MALGPLLMISLQIQNGHHEFAWLLDVWNLVKNKEHQCGQFWQFMSDSHKKVTVENLLKNSNDPPPLTNPHRQRFDHHCDPYYSHKNAKDRTECKTPPAQFTWQPLNFNGRAPRFNIQGKHFLFTKGSGFFFKTANKRNIWDGYLIINFAYKYYTHFNKKCSRKNNRHWNTRKWAMESM